MSLTFDGQKIDGFAGDTIASALLANGIGIVGRSFKYHRPRGVWGLGVEEPNAIVDVTAPRPIRNCRATTEEARDGMDIRSVNASPTAAKDRYAFIDKFARFLPSAFYYKTFMWPDWHLFEPRIREMAGLSVLDPREKGQRPAEQVTDRCDLLVIGGGPVGLFAALAASEVGKSVILCDDGLEFGGALRYRSANIDGLPGAEWIAQTLTALRSQGVLLLSRTTAFGIYDHGLVGLNERQQGDSPDRLWRLRPGAILLATGAIERPLPFANNDVPGVMSAQAGLGYLRQYGVAVGREIVVATNNGFAGEAAIALENAGSKVTVIDYRAGRQIVAARGSARVSAVTLDDGRVLPADAVLVSGGFTPTLHLYCQASGKLRWDPSLITFVPGNSVDGVFVAGAAAGQFDLRDAFESARTALNYMGVPLRRGPSVDATPVGSDIVAAWPAPQMKGRVWIDLQHDVTAKDIELAARENFVSVEHLKRYTTLGMATDQGKTSNLSGIALMAQLTGRSIPEVGTTTYRPPFTPVPLSSFAGKRGGALMDPPRRLVLEADHRAEGAQFREYGGWLRPAWYGSDTEDQAVQREAKKAREAVALFDGSPLGKIEVLGPQAAEFLDFIYYNTMSTLKPGRCRYGFMLAESGLVYDDGVLFRLSENHFVVSCSSGHASGVFGLLQEWRQDRLDCSKLFIHNATTETATLTVTGPRSRALLEAVDLGVSLDDTTLPHMGLAWGQFEGESVRLAGVSFTGDRSYEVSIRADRAAPLWNLLKEKGRQFGAILLGVEALLLLRAEKGFLMIGKDTDSETMPMDLGVGAPRAKKQIEYLGRRSLHTHEANRNDRKQLVGLEVVDGDAPLPTGAHGVETAEGRRRSLGYVTSSYFSPTLNRPIALALIERGTARIGEAIDIQHLGKFRRARVVSPCAFDEAGDRLNA